jgi:sulfate adenylyltransferase subunit 1 (EFTu-like GTPase family)
MVYERKYAELCDLVDDFHGKGKKYLLKLLLKRLYKEADEIEDEMDAEDISNNELAKLDSEWNQIDHMISQVEEQLEARR